MFYVITQTFYYSTKCITSETFLKITVEKLSVLICSKNIKISGKNLHWF